jgi:hypothetical protein
VWLAVPVDHSAGSQDTACPDRHPGSTSTRAPSQQPCSITIKRGPGAPARLDAGPISVPGAIRRPAPQQFDTRAVRPDRLRPQRRDQLQLQPRRVLDDLVDEAG